MTARAAMCSRAAIAEGRCGVGNAATGEEGAAKATQPWRAEGAAKATQPWGKKLGRRQTSPN
eukprot:363963-Chlamydomonas_euryale.AAC.2